MTLDEAKDQRKKHFALEMIHQHKEDSEAKEVKSDGKDFVLQEVELQSHQQLGRDEVISEDISAYAISENEDDIDRYKESLKKVVNEEKEGKKVSHRIMANVESKTLERLKFRHDR